MTVTLSLTDENLGLLRTLVSDAIHNLEQTIDERRGAAAWE